jgi:hypothetical protein
VWTGCVKIQRSALIVTVMPRLIPAEDGIFDRHPEKQGINQAES